MSSTRREIGERRHCIRCNSAKAHRHERGLFVLKKWIFCSKMSFVIKVDVLLMNYDINSDATTIPKQMGRHEKDIASREMTFCNLRLSLVLPPSLS